MKIELRCANVLVCSLCERIRDAERVDETLTSVALFGQASVYAVCPCCHQDVKDFSSKDWQRRVRVWLFENGRALPREKS